MFYCKMSIFLAYAMAVYCLASGYYFIFSKFAGTPFRDSLSIQQIKIKKQSSGKRKNIFIQGIIIALIILYFLKPFSNCLTE
jgi:hypothetical protein